MKVFIGLLIATLLPVALSQFGSCSIDDVRVYIDTLPNGAACNQAENMIVPVRSPSNTDSELENAISTYCTQDCAGAQAGYVARPCGAPDVAGGLVAFCLPTGAASGLNRCRFVLPDYLDDVLIMNLTACADFNASSPTCPDGCSGALQSFITAVGCCYPIMYGSGIETIAGFVEGGYATQMQADLIGSIIDPLLWSTCSVPIPLSCSGHSFAGPSTLAVGNCTNTQINTFTDSLSDTCASSHDVVFATGPSPSIDELEDAYNVICTEDCQGAVEDYEIEKCGDSYVTSVGTNLCLKTSGNLGSRCYFTIGENFDSTIFDNAAISCLALGPQFETCPDFCQAALTELNDQLGCCYQSFYNSTEFLDFLLYAGFISFQDRFFFGTIGSPQIWNVCDVPLVPACTGEPLSGADHLLSSSIVFILTMFLLALFY